MGRCPDIFTELDNGSNWLKICHFTKADRVRKSEEYRFLSKHGIRCHCDHFLFVVTKNESSRSRLGITVSKKVGKAVTRNRIKRIIREYFRLNRGTLPGRLDINIIAKKSSGTVAASVIRDQLATGFKKIARKSESRHG